MYLQITKMSTEIHIFFVYFLLIFLFSMDLNYVQEIECININFIGDTNQHYCILCLI